MFVCVDKENNTIRIKDPEETEQSTMKNTFAD